MSWRPVWAILQVLDQPGMYKTLTQKNVCIGGHIYLGVVVYFIIPALGIGMESEAEGWRVQGLPWATLPNCVSKRKNKRKRKEIQK